MKNLVIGILVLIALYFIAPTVIALFVVICANIGAVISTILPFLGLVLIIIVVVALIVHTC